MPVSAKTFDRCKARNCQDCFFTKWPGVVKAQQGGQLMPAALARCAITKTTNAA